MRGSRIVLLAVLTGLVSSSPALAAFPGQNGKIAFSGKGPDGNQDIYVATPGVPGVERLTDASGIDARPAWSPDGTRIAFSTRRHGFDEIYVMRADGTDETRLTFGSGREPAWSPDGTQLAFWGARDSITGLYVMDADGTDVTFVTPASGLALPAWSPDGTRIAYYWSGPGIPELRLVSPDGSGDARLIRDAIEPDWSPDGTKIAFSHGYAIGDRDHPCIDQVDHELFWTPTPPSQAEYNPLVSYPGSECPSLPFDTEPAWSPDGTKVAWRQCVSHDQCPYMQVSSPDPSVIKVRDQTDGTVTTLDELSFSAQPDWQPVQPGYARPKGATSMRASLVPAYIQCASPNRTHGPPLDSASCSPPQQRSAVLTTGGAPAGAAAQMTGSVRLTVQAGNAATPADEADVAVKVSITDVRCRTTNAACPGGAGADYEGRLLGVLTGLRITDRSNTPPGPVGVPGTGESVLQVPVQCAATASSAAGATCSTSTTVDALLPGAVTEGKRAVWELGQIHVRDAGPNGTGFESPACPPTCGDGDETLFLREGVFVP